MSTVFVDHYAVLGVGRDASMKDINDAWKRIALKYHPDKCNHTEDSIEKFRTGREAVEILRDPLRRRALDRQLEAHTSYHRASETGRGRYPHQPSAGYSRPMNSQSYYSTGPRYFYKRHYHWGEGRRGNNFDGPSRTYLSEAEMDRIFEMVKARERERLAAEACKAAQAKAGPEAYREQAKPVKRPWGGDDYASIELEARKARAERRKEGFRARVMRDEEELAAGSDKMEGDDSLKRSPGTFSIGDTSAMVYQSTVYKSAKSSLRNSSSCDGGVTPAATLSKPHYRSTQSSGSYLADSMVGYQSENTNGPDNIDGPPNAASPGPSSSSVRPEHHRDDAHNIANAEKQWPLRVFIPFIKAKLNDPSGCYTPEDMHQELDGLITEAMCKWMETTRRSFTNSSQAAGTTDGSACSHVGFWHKKLGEAECQNCHLWKPLLVLTCPDCGLKKCVRCKFENSDTEKVVA